MNMPKTLCINANHDLQSTTYYIKRVVIMRFIVVFSEALNRRMQKTDFTKCDIFFRGLSII